ERAQRAVPHHRPCQRRDPLHLWAHWPSARRLHAWPHHRARFEGQHLYRRDPDRPPRAALQAGPFLTGGSMEQRNLGRSGLRVSLVALGCNNFGERLGLEEARAIVHKALDLGITLFDTADRYGGPGGSEKALGEI